MKKFVASSIAFYLNSVVTPSILSLVLSVAWLAPVSADDRPEPGRPSPVSEANRRQHQFFEAKVRPLLAQHCFKCHGPDKQKGGLRLDHQQFVRTGGDSGSLWTAGKPDESLLIEAVRYESFEMPPSGKLSEGDIQTLVRWIAEGAYWPEQAPLEQAEVKGFVPGRIREEDRRHWSFVPRQPVQPPPDESGWAQTPVDAFVRARLIERGWQPAKPATPSQLIRRLYLDLTGLPPTPQQVEEYIANPSGEKYREIVDRLLESPRFGEHWASFWLDLVRYADSDGYKADFKRPDAWRYRDYVIGSFNQDKPYREFVLEQLAGDEYAPDDPDALVATGFLRMGVYEYNQRDVRAQWDAIVNEVTDVTADVFLAMGMSCARCHDHKFDPLLQRDYFQLRAFFEPMVWRDDCHLAPQAQRQEYEQKRGAWEQATQSIRDEIDQLIAPLKRNAANSAIDKFPLDIRPLMRADSGELTPHERQLVALAYRQVTYEYERLEPAKKLKGESLARYQELSRQLAQFPEPTLPTGMTVSDIGLEAPPTHIPGRSSESVAPGYLTVLSNEDALIPELSSRGSTGRRLALAEWITTDDHPLTSRVIVNRIWARYFGRGIVATTSDFGRLGEPPSHPNLLDWLANRLVEQQWKLKDLHRLLVTSAVYQQGTENLNSPEVHHSDPQNLWLARMPIRRLQAEQIRDSILAVTGELLPQPPQNAPSGQHRHRAVFGAVMRNSIDPLLATLDAPDRISSTADRYVTTTPLQSLTLINGDWSLARARALATNLRDVSRDTRGQIQELYQRAFSRKPTDEEMAAAVAFLANQVALAERQRPVPGFAEQVDQRWVADVTPGRSARLAMMKSSELPQGDLTIEATVLIRGVDDNSAVRTLASQWTSKSSDPGWSVGVTGQKSGYEPRNVILQLVGEDATGQMIYEVIPSYLHLKLNTPYFVAVSVDLDDPTPQGVRFYVQDLKTGAVRTAQVAHQVTRRPTTETPLVVGGRFLSKTHDWDGWIDDVRLSKAALRTTDLLVNDTQTRADTIGYWTFAKRDAFLRDQSGRENHFHSSTAGVQHDPRLEGLVDLCHAILNSNEFLYLE